MKLLKQYQVMRCVIMQMRKQILSHSVTKENQEMVKPIFKSKCDDFKSHTLTVLLALALSSGKLKPDCILAPFSLLSFYWLFQKYEIVAIIRM